MSWWASLLSLIVALALQAGLGGVWPGAHRYVDLFLVPVVWAGVAGTQRSAMLLGCAGGLIQDAWFQAGAFGIGGFKKTLLGWALGGVAALLDLNQVPGRFVAGILVSLGDALLDVSLRRFLDQTTPVPGVVELLIKAVVTGALVVLVGQVVDRRRESRSRWRVSRMEL